MLRKVCGSIALLLMPVLIFFAVTNMVRNGGVPNGDLVPNFESIWSYFATFPNVNDEIAAFVQAAKFDWGSVEYYFSVINDWNSFWVAIGAWFNWIGNLFALLWNIVLVPIRLIGWLFMLFVR